MRPPPGRRTGGISLLGSGRCLPPCPAEPPGVRIGRLPRYSIASLDAMYNKINSLDTKLRLTRYSCQVIY